MSKEIDLQIITALKGSIKKWKEIVDGTGVDQGTENCPLCKLYYHKLYYHGEGFCIKCPISEYVASRQCTGTPYHTWDEHQRLEHGEAFPFKVSCDVCKELAEKEVEFLERVLKENK